MLVVQELAVEWYIFTLLQMMVGLGCYSAHPPTAALCSPRLRPRSTMTATASYHSWCIEVRPSAEEALSPILSPKLDHSDGRPQPRLGPRADRGWAHAYGRDLKQQGRQVLFQHGSGSGGVLQAYGNHFDGSEKAMFDSIVLAEASWEPVLGWSSGLECGWFLRAGAA